MKNAYATPNNCYNYQNNPNNRLDIFVNCNDDDNNNNKNCNKQYPIINEIIHYGSTQSIENGNCGYNITNSAVNAKTVRKYLITPVENGTITFSIKDNLTNFVSKQKVSVYGNSCIDTSNNNFFEGVIYNYDKDNNIEDQIVIY
jgi:hypothetical protein